MTTGGLQVLTGVQGATGVAEVTTVVQGATGVAVVTTGVQGCPPRFVEMTTVGTGVTTGRPCGEIGARCP